MRSRDGHVEAADRARRERQRPAREGRESNSRVTPRTVQGTRDPWQSSLRGDEQRYARAMRQLRVCVRALSATLVAAATRALIDGLTVGLRPRDGSHGSASGRSALASAPRLPRDELW
jgi:hypothetical protein